MIVWLASYPRSGNTFTRIVLHRLYGAPTYSVYNDNDPVAQRIGPDLVGYRPKPAERAVMGESAEVFFMKTHKRRKDDGYPAIYLVRDGRDAVVSKAHLLASDAEATGSSYHKPDEMTVTGQSGSALLFNGHLWHSGTRNNSRSSGRALQSVFWAREAFPPYAEPLYDRPDELAPAIRYILGL